MEGRKVKKIRMKADCFSPSSKDKSKEVYAEKGEVLKVNTQRDDVLIVKGKKQIFPINIKLVEILEYE